MESECVWGGECGSWLEVSEIVQVIAESLIIGTGEDGFCIWTVRNYWSSGTSDGITGDDTPADIELVVREIGGRELICIIQSPCIGESSGWVEGSFGDKGRLYPGHITTDIDIPSDTELIFQGDECMGRSIVWEDDASIYINISSYDDERARRSEGIEDWCDSRVRYKEVGSASGITVVDSVIENGWTRICRKGIDEGTCDISEIEGDFLTSIIDDGGDGGDIEMSSLFIIRETEGIDIFSSDIPYDLHGTDKPESDVIYDGLECYPSEGISPEPSWESGSIWIVFDSRESESSSKITPDSSWSIPYFTDAIRYHSRDDIGSSRELSPSGCLRPEKSCDPGSLEIGFLVWRSWIFREREYSSISVLSLEGS